MVELKPIYNRDMAKKYSVTVAALYGLIWQASKQGADKIQLSFNEIAEYLGLCRRTILRNIKKLENEGLIVVSRTTNERNMYSVKNINIYPCR